MVYSNVLELSCEINVILMIVKKCCHYYNVKPCIVWLQGPSILRPRITKHIKILNVDSKQRFYDELNLNKKRCKNKTLSVKMHPS